VLKFLFFFLCTLYTDTHTHTLAHSMYFRWRNRNRSDCDAATGFGFWSCFQGPLTDAATDNTHLIAQNDAIVERCICHIHLHTSTPPHHRTQILTHTGERINITHLHHPISEWKAQLQLFWRAQFKAGCKNRRKLVEKGC